MIEGSECPCGKKVVPNREICPACGQTMQKVSFQGRGTVMTHTTLYTVPEGFSAPITLAVVGLSEGPYILCSCMDDTGMSIGDPVVVREEKNRYLCETGK